MPNFLKLTVWTHCPIAPAVVVWQVTPVGMGNSPPEMNVAELAGDRRQIWLRQRFHHARALHRAQGSGDRWQTSFVQGCPDQSVLGDKWSTVGRERIVVFENDCRGAVVHAGAEIDAQLLDDVPPHFRDGDLEHHLVAAANDDRIDDLFGAADQPRRDLAGLLGLDRRGHGAGQDDAVADALDLDAGQGLLQRGAHAVEVTLDRDVVGSDLLAVGIEKHDVGLADRAADDIGALRGTNDGIGDLRVGDQHVLDVAWQVDDHGLADAERQEAHLDRTDGRCRNRILLGLGCDDRQQRSERQRGGGRQ